MGNVNYGRLIAGALLAAVFYFIADGTIHGALLGKYHMAAVTKAVCAIKSELRKGSLIL